eukprot:symbB.v1.2.007287.t1/scaffold438.1/size205425/15
MAGQTSDWANRLHVFDQFLHPLLLAQLRQSERRCEIREEEVEEWKKEECQRFEREVLHQRSNLASDQDGEVMAISWPSSKWTQVKERQDLQQEFLEEKRSFLDQVIAAESAAENTLKAERRRAANAAQHQEEKWQAQQAVHQAEVAHLTTKYEKALLKSSFEQARLLSRYETEKEEWASDWKDLNGLIKPLIQQHEAAEAEMASRQAAAQEGMDLFQRFAQLKDLQIKELQQANQKMEVTLETGAECQAQAQLEVLPTELKSMKPTSQNSARSEGVSMDQTLQDQAKDA